jgi:hypothetical protein
MAAKWAGRLRPLFEGWRLSGIAALLSGNRFHPLLPGDANNDGLRYDRPDRRSSGELPKSQRSIDRWFDTAAFVVPASYSFGNSGRNILTGPGRRTWDLSFIKRTPVSRRGDVLELRIQLFNAFNHANFTDPSLTVGTAIFGKVFGADRSREIEIAVKYTF